MKKLATKLLVALGLLTSGGVMAQTLTNEAVTATWAFDLGTEGQQVVLTNASGEDVTSSYLKGNYVTTGSNLDILNKVVFVQDVSRTDLFNVTQVQPKASTGEIDVTEADCIDFVINPKKGLSFTPTSVSFKASRFSTGGGFMNIYWLNPDGTYTNNTLASGQKPERSADKSLKYYSSYNYTVTNPAVGQGACGLRIQIYGLANNKQFGFCDIVIKGTLSGTAEEETLYTITTSTNPADAGSITQSPAGANIALGEKVTFTPVANTGYTFLNKWTVNDVEVEGATYTIESLSANTTVVAQFEKNPVLSFAKPEGVYCVDRMFPKGVNTVAKGGKATLPAANYMYYKEGYTMTGWSIGGTDYAFGAEVTLNEDVTAEPVFAKNTVSLAARSAEVTVTYDFNTSTNGGRLVNIENNADKVITRITVDGQEIDYVMDADCRDNAGVNGKRGKLNNTSGTTAQCNQGTVLTIHDAVKGSVITLTCNSKFTTATTFNGAAGTLDGSKAIYTATEDGDVKVIVKDESISLTTITVTYPYVAPKSYTLTTDDDDFYTLYLDYAVTVPENITVYTGALNGSTLTLNAVTDEYIKAGNAVIVKGTDAGTYTFTEKKDAEAGTYEGNDLKGVTVETAVADLKAAGTVLTLGTDSKGIVGFRKPNNDKVSANKAYLVAPAAAPTFVNILLPGEATGIQGIQSVQQKSADSAIYNMMGQRVGANAKGLILMNGKKVIRK